MTDQVATVIVTAVGIHTGTRPPLFQIDGIVPDAPSTVKKKPVKRQNGYCIYCYTPIQYGAPEICYYRDQTADWREERA